MSPRLPWIGPLVFLGGGLGVYGLTRAPGPAYAPPFDPVAWCAASHVHLAFHGAADLLVRAGPSAAAGSLQWLTATAILACAFGLARLLGRTGADAAVSLVAASAFLLSRGVWQEATRISAEPLGSALIVAACVMVLRERVAWRVWLAAMALTALAVTENLSLLAFVPTTMAVAALKATSARTRRTGLAVAVLSALGLIMWLMPAVQVEEGAARDLLTALQPLGVCLAAVGVASGVARLRARFGWAASAGLALTLLTPPLTGATHQAAAASWPLWLLIGVGLTWIGEASRRRFVPLALGATLAASALVSNWAWADRRHDDLGKRFVTAAVAALPTDVVLAVAPGAARDLAWSLRAGVSAAGHRVALIDLSAARIGRHLAQGRDVVVLADSASVPVLPGYAAEIVSLLEPPLADYLQAVPSGEWLAVAASAPAWIAMDQTARGVLARACGIDSGTPDRSALACVLQHRVSGAVAVDARPSGAEVHVLSADALGGGPAYSPVNVQAAASSGGAWIRHNSAVVVSAPGIAVARFSRDGRLREVRGLAPGEERAALTAGPWHLMRYVKQ